MPTCGRIPTTSRRPQPSEPIAHAVAGSLLAPPVWAPSCPPFFMGSPPKYTTPQISLPQGLLRGDPRQDGLVRDSHRRWRATPKVTEPRDGGRGCLGSSTWRGGRSPPPALARLLALVSTVGFPSPQERYEAPESFFHWNVQKKKKKNGKRQDQERISWKHFFGVL